MLTRICQSIKIEYLECEIRIRKGLSNAGSLRDAIESVLKEAAY
jgi:hypothetical protein